MISVVVVLAVTCLVVSSMLMLYKSMWGSPKEKYTNQKQKKKQKQKQIQLQIAKKQLQKKLAKQKAETDKLKKMTLKESKQIFEPMRLKGNKQDIIKYLLTLPVDIRLAFIRMTMNDYDILNDLPPNVLKELKIFEQNHSSKLEYIVAQSKNLTEEQIKNKVKIAQSLSMTELVKYIRSLAMPEAVQVLEFIGKTEYEKMRQVIMYLPLLEAMDLNLTSMFLTMGKNFSASQQAKQVELEQMTVNEYKNIFNSMKNNKQELIKYVTNLPVDIRAAFMIVLMDSEDTNKLMVLLPHNVSEETINYLEKKNKTLVNYAKSFKHLDKNILQNSVKYTLSLSPTEQIKYIMKLDLSESVQIVLNMPPEIADSLPLLYAIDLAILIKIIKRID